MCKQGPFFTHRGPEFLPATPCGCCMRTQCPGSRTYPSRCDGQTRRSAPCGVRRAPSGREGRTPVAPLLSARKMNGANRPLQLPTRRHGRRPDWTLPLSPSLAGRGKNHRKASALKYTQASVSIASRSPKIPLLLAGGAGPKCQWGCQGATAPHEALLPVHQDTRGCPGLRPPRRPCGLSLKLQGGGMGCRAHAP